MNTICKASDAEELVLSVLWNATEELNAKTVMNRVNSSFEKSWKPQTVSTFLSRLRAKGFINMRRQGKDCFYSPIHTREAYREFLVNQMVIRFYNGSHKDLLENIVSMMPNEGKD